MNKSLFLTLLAIGICLLIYGSTCPNGFWALPLGLCGAVVFAFTIGIKLMIWSCCGIVPWRTLTIEIEESSEVYEWKPWKLWRGLKGETKRIK